MPVFNNALAGAAGSGGAGDYEIERSLRFNDDDSAYLNRTPSSAGNRKTWTYSTWCKQATPGQAGILLNAQNGTTQGFADNFWILFYAGTVVVGDGSVDYLNTNKLRDPSAWYHIVVACDTTQSSASDKLKIYINGVESEYTGDARSSITTDSLTAINSTYLHRIGDSGSYHAYFDGYLAETHLVDGQALAPTDFGEFDADTGVWNPKRFSGNHGTNGFHLDYSDNSSAGAFGDDRNAPDYNKLGGATTTTTGAGTFYYGHDSNRLFDGNTANQLFGGWVNTGDDSNVIWSPPTGAYSVNSGGNNLRVYAGYYSNISVNGVSKATGNGNNAAAWVTLAHTGAITEIKVENTTNDNVARIGGIEVNGQLLTTKAWTVNNLQAAISGNGNYIANLSSNGSNTYTQDAPNFLRSFDGNLSTQWNIARSATVVDGTLTFPGGYTMQDANNGLRIYTGASWHISTSNYRVYYQVNGSGYTMIGSNSDTNAVGAPKRWVTIPVSGGTLNSLSVRTHSDNGSWGSSWASAVELDGVILTDNLVSIGNDSYIDSPTDYEASGSNNGGNYATLNPLYKQSEVQLANGNLDVTFSGPQGHAAYSTIAMQSGKYYFEVVSGANTSIGIRRTNKPAGNWPGTDGAGYGYAPDGRKVNSGTYYSFGTAHSIGDIIGVAFDADTGKLWFRHNGTWQASGNPASGSNPAFTVTVDPDSYGWYATVGYWTSPGTNVNSFNAGQRPFSGTPPTGFKPLCTQSLNDPTIQNSNTAFDAHAYDGTGQAKTVSGLKLSPDMAWIKERDGTSWPRIIDAVRGQKEVFPNRNAQQASFTQGLNQFTSDGFVLGTGADSNVNTNNKKYIAWLWGGGSSFSNSANTNGASVASSGKTNTSAGFAVATFTSPASGNFSIAHGLNQAPEFVMVKTTGAQGDWTIFHKDVMTSTQHYLVLNNSNPRYTYNNIWGSGLPSSSVINMTSAGAVANGHTCVAYSFAPIEGFSAFGKYTGNSGQNFQHLGFQPRWIMIKNTTSSNYTAYTGWAMFDTERQPFNVNLNALWANNSSDEGKRGNGSTASAPDFGIDILSNGFCLRDNGASEINLNGETYVYAAFAEHSFKYARAR